MEHFLPAIAEARSLDAADLQSAAQVVDDQGGQGFCLHILCDDQQGFAHLCDLFQNGQQVLNDGDLLVMDEHQRLVQDSFHLLGVSDHIRSDIAAVELHAFHDLGISLSGLGFFHRDNAVVGDLFHGLGDELADGLVTRGDSADTGDVSRCR